MGGKRQFSDIKCPEGVEIRCGSTLRIIFRYRGVRCRESLKLKATASNIKYAANLRGEILNAIGRCTFNYATYFPKSKNAKKFGCHIPSNITIGSMLEKYLQLAERTLEPSTYEDYRNKTWRYLMPIFQNIPIRELTPAMLREWIAGLKLTIKTIQNALTPLRAIIDTALIDEIIDKNPLDHIIVSKLVSKETSKSSYEVDPFNKDEIKAILNTAQGQVKNLFQFAFFTGLRTSELIALEWGDIDWIKGQVCVRRAYVKGRIKTTKTKAGRRDVLLLLPALAALNAQKAYTFLYGQRIFHYPLKNTPWKDPGQIRQQAWQYVLRRAGVRYRNPYQTRHTYASMMLSNNENIMWVAKQMGHATTEMVMRTYGKWLPDYSVAAGYKPIHNWDNHIQLQETNSPNLAPQTSETNFFNKNLSINQEINWRSLGDSNPCYRRERAVS